MAEIVPFVGRNLRDIALDRIIEDPYLPRKKYSEEALLELAGSMRDGLMQAVIVSERGDGYYTLVAGSRRLRAARAGGFTVIPCVIVDVSSPCDIVVLALAENVQREELDPLEEANAYLWLFQEYGLQPSDIAKRLSKNVSHIRNRLKLLDLAPSVQHLVAEGSLAPSTAVVLANIIVGEEQVAVAQEVVRQGLAAGETTQLIRERQARYVGQAGKPREMTVQKYRLRVAGIRQSVEQAFALIESAEMTPEERGRLMQVHLELEEASRRIRDRISAGGRVSLGINIRKSSGNVPTARSHGTEWPAGHVQLLEDKSLSDEDIAEQIGRNVSAVAAMRKELRRKKTRRR